MKPILCLLLSLGLAVGHLAAEGHPMASRIRAYREANPIEPRIPVLLIWVSQQSEQLDTAGREALTRGRYGDAVDLFRRAVDSDDDNSMAWYDLARAHARAGDYLETARVLREAVSRDWFWGLDLMVSPDFEGGRTFGLHASVDERDMWGEIQFTHVFTRDGTVTLLAPAGRGDAGRKIGTGYYAVIGGAIFEFFPELGEYAVEGPNGSDVVPASANQARVPDIASR